MLHIKEKGYGDQTGSARSRELHTEIIIQASPQKVWKILTEFDRYPEWNPFIRSFEGTLRPIERFKVVLQSPGGRKMTFKPRCLVLEPERELRWLGSLFMQGIFDGEHIFELHPHGKGQTRFVQRELFSGWLVPLLWNQLNTDTRKGFEMMNAALKERAES